MNFLEKLKYKNILNNVSKKVLLKEIFRKSIHMMSAFIPFFAEFSYLYTLFFLSGCAAVYILCEILRLKGFSVPIISAVTNIASRKRDNIHFVMGPVTLCAGLILSLLLFPQKIAAPAIFALAFGDGFASIAGQLLGHRKIPFSTEKTAAGSLACFSAIFISVFLLIGNPLKALAAALSASLAEALPFKNFDNILIPLSAGVSLMFFS